MRLPRWAQVLVVLAAVGIGGYWAGQWAARPTAESALTSAPLEGAEVARVELAVSAPVSPANLSEDERRTVEVYRRASPAVVNITTRTVEWDFFYGATPGGGTGSGFIVSEDGIIVTNLHVVQGAQQIQVTLSDRTSFPGRVVGFDPLTDLAVVQIEPKERKLPTLPLGDSNQLQVGQRVIAIGNPFGFQATLTTGVVSALQRTLPTRSGALIDEAIQTDAAINPGNSGGPLLDSQGRAIGINTLIFTPTGGSVGIGFAIPVSTLKLILTDLVRHGRPQRPWLGIRTIEVFPDLARALKLPVESGVMIADVVRGAPAAGAGLQGSSRSEIIGRMRYPVGGDIIVAVDGQKVESVLDLNRILAKKRPQDSIEVSFYRGGEKRSLRVQLALRPPQ
ncbi:MAG: S1C family serine protease [Candidatus Acidiferrales bacterium]